MRNFKLNLFVVAALGVAFCASHAQAAVTVIEGSGSTFVGNAPAGSTVPADPVDIALASGGATPFAISEYGGPHTIAHLNDGLYGNSYSWISAGLSDARNVDLGGSYGTVNMSFAGVELSNLYTITGFTFGRSNLGEYGDRIGGTMYIQYAPAASPDLTDPSATYDSLWTTIGSLTTTDVYDHVFALNSPLVAAGLRIVTQAGNCIDEIAMYGSVFVAGPTWTGGGGAPGNWNDAGNWDTGAPVEGNSITFATNTTTTTNNDIPGLQVADISFGSTAGAFVNGGNSITLSGDIGNSSASVQTINHDIGLIGTEGPQTIEAASGDIIINGAIGNGDASDHGIVKDGSQALVLAGGNTYTGSTVINAGTLRVGTAGNLGSGTSVELAGGTLDLRSDAGTDFGKDVTVTGNAAINVDRAVSGSGSNQTHTLGALAIGAQTLTVSGDNGYQLALGAVTASDAATINNNAAGTLTLASLAQTATAAKTVSLGGTGNTTIAGAMSQNGTNALSLAKNGGGTVTLTGTNSYTGGTTINNGTLQIGVGGSIDNTSGIAVNSTGTLDVSPVDASPFTVASGQTITIASGGKVMGNLAIASGAVLTGEGSLVGSTSGESVTVNGTISPGTYGTMSSTDGTGTLSVGDGTNDVGLNLGSSSVYYWGLSPTASGTINVTGSVTIDSGAQVRLQPWGADFTGPYTILTWTSGSAPSTLPTLSYAAPGGKLNWVGTAGDQNWDTGANWDGKYFTGGSLTVSGQSLVLDGVTTVISNPSSLSQVVIAPAAGVSVTGPAAENTVLSLEIGLSNGTSASSLTLVPGGPLNVTTSATVNPGATLTVNGTLNTDSLVTTGTTTFASGANVSFNSMTVNAGTLSVADGDQLGSSGSSVVLDGTGVLEFTGTSPSYSGAADFTINSGTATIQVDNAATTLALAGSVGGAGSLTKSGAGTVNFTGPVAVNGNLTVNADGGTASFSNTTDILGNVTVNNGGKAILSGSSGIGGTVTVNGGGTLDWSSARNASGDPAASIVTVGSTGTAAAVASISVPVGTTLMTGFINAGYGTGATGSAAGHQLTLSGGGTIDPGGNSIAIGMNGGTGTLNVAGDSTMVVNLSGTGSPRIYLGKGTGSVGYLNISGGTINGQYNEWGLSGGTAIIYQTGGTWGRGAPYVGGAGGVGVSTYTMTGGSITTSAVVGQGVNGKLSVLDAGAYNGGGMVLGGSTSTGTLNIAAGGSVITSQVQGPGGNVLLNNMAGVTGVINLGPGGLLSLSGGICSDYQGVTPDGATGTMNFSGGTLQYRINAASISYTEGVWYYGYNKNRTWMGGWTHAYIYAGGLTVDTQSYTGAFSQALEAATGSGVTSVTLDAPGAGYTAAPIVSFLNGTLVSGIGVEAEAIATWDQATGEVTGIVIVNPGQYTVLPDTVVLSRAAGDLDTWTSAATVSIGSTASNAGGGVTKLGTGTLTLTGENTYTGSTIVQAGTLSYLNLGDGLDDDSAVSIALDAFMNLNFFGSDTIAELWLDDVEMAPGTYGSSDPTYGSYFTGDGSLFVKIGLPDADGNGVVNAADYIALKRNMGQATGATTAQGDFDGDGDVDWHDLQILQAHYGATSAAGAAGTIPEPGSAILLMFGAAALLRRRRMS